MSEPKSDTSKLFPEGFVYVPVSQPPCSKRELVSVYCFSFIIALLLHVAAIWAIGYYIELRNAEIEITMAWSNEPLTGFGMMEEVEDWQSMEGESETPSAVEPDEDPFEESEEVATAEPDLDPDSIVLPEPEPDAIPEDNVPAYDLKRDKARMDAVRKDVSSMPNLHVLAPGNAKLIVLIRNDRVVGSRFENSVRNLFRAFPDYRFTLGQSEIDPVNDIQALLIATANPELYAETFLVVSHKIPRNKLKEYITASFPTRLTWQEHNGQPLAVPDKTDGKYNPRSGIYARSVYLPDDNTVLFLRTEVLPTLDIAHVDAIVNTRDNDKDPQQAKTFLQSLGAIADSDSASMPTLFMMLQGIEDVRLGPKFPSFEAPKAIMASMSTADRPLLNMEAFFSDSKAAQTFVDSWPDIKDAAGSLGIPGLGGLLGGLLLAAEDDKVLLTGELNGAMISLILMFAAKHLERNS
ncbi:MAG: hypothetical protein IJU23_04830 [Proteobacteria bacterium]|nr:hypothetical protein [Pseudomonadota bacterium]